MHIALVLWRHHLCIYSASPILIYDVKQTNKKINRSYYSLETSTYSFIAVIRMKQQEGRRFEKYSYVRISSVKYQSVEYKTHELIIVRVIKWHGTLPQNQME